VANEEQAKFWTEVTGPIWLQREEDLDVVARSFGFAAMDAADVASGEKVIDVGCGTGTTVVELAKRVGDEGHVLGLDISPLLLSRAEERAREAGLTNVEFVDADAQTHDLSSRGVDLVFSRFGIMFFEDPVAAFANLRAATRPGGRIAFACWQDVFSNAWMSMPTMAASSVLGQFELPPEGSPGPFVFADTDRVQKILTDAGYADVAIEPFTTTMDTESVNVDEWARFMVQMGPLSGAYAEATEDVQKKTIVAILEALGPYEDDGTYRLPAAAWIVTARN
jgi:SAM-dependent methyltransferase